MKAKPQDGLRPAAADRVPAGAVHNVFPGNEWACRPPQELGLNPEALARVGALMEEARSNGVLICHGYIAAEWTYDGSCTRRFDVQSVTKSITSLLLGLALQDELIPSLDAPVKAHYPAFEAGPYSDEITFRHLVTCTSGIKAERAKKNYNADRFVKPGVESRYHNDHTLQLARVLTYLYEKDLETVLHERVLDRIAATMHWRPPYREPAVRVLDGREWKNGLPAAVVTARGEIVRMVSGCDWSEWTARDLARVGWLYANGGTWEGTQVLPADYVAESMRPIPEPVMERRSPERYAATCTDGRPYDRERAAPGLTYGLAWWASRQMVDGQERWMWNMGGNYGQTCMVWPERGLVLVKVNTPRKPPFIGGPRLWPPLIEAAQTLS